MKKIFTFLTAVLLCTCMSTWASTIEIGPSSIKAVHLANYSSLYQMRIYTTVNSQSINGKQLCFNITINQNPNNEKVVSSPFAPDGYAANQNLYAYSEVSNANQLIGGSTGVKLLTTPSSLTGSISKVWTDLGTTPNAVYYKFDITFDATGNSVVLQNNNYKNDKQTYHLVGYFKDGISCTAGIGADMAEEFSLVYPAEHSFVTSLKNAENKGTTHTALYFEIDDDQGYSNLVYWHFDNMTTNYVPTGKYLINGNGGSNTVMPYKQSYVYNYKSDTERGEIASMIGRVKETAWNWQGIPTSWDTKQYYPEVGEMVVINPNRSSEHPLYVHAAYVTSALIQRDQQNFSFTNQFIYVPNSSMQKRSVTVSAVGNKFTGSASISCAEGYGYANNTLADFSHPGNYYYDGTRLTLNPPTAKAGYHCTGWSKTSGGSNVYTSTNPVITVGSSTNNNGTFYANFTANTYNVVFNANGGTGTMSNQSHTYGSSKALTSNAFTAPTGKHFIGWATSQSRANAGTVDYTNGQSVSNLSTTHDATVDLYAVWAANTFTVRFNANGGGSSMNNQNFTYGTSQNLTANAFTAPTGKHFAGWATSEANATAGTVAYANSARGDQITTGNGVTVDLWAVWAVNTYTVTLAVDGTNNWGSLDVTEIANVPHGAAIVVSGNTITINNGSDVTSTATHTSNAADYSYDFGSWKNGETTLTGSSNTVTSAMTITAHFTRTLNTYTVTVAKNENAYGTLSEESNNTVTVASVPYGTVISTSTNTVTINGTTVTATKAENTAQYTYAFANWTNGTATVTGNTTVTANFTRTLNTYTVTIVSNNTDYGTVDEDEVASVPYGTTITTDANTIDVNGTTVTATKAENTAQYTYAFANWTNGTATVTGDLTVTATFTATPNITEFNLEDSYASGDSYYTTYNTLIGRTIDITYKRSFTAGRWATFSLPFGYSFQTHSEDNPFKDQVFTLTSVDYAGGRMVINCVKNSTGIVANKPYILIPTSDIDNPTFVGVTPVAIAAGSQTVNNTKDDVYTVEFISTAYKQTLSPSKRTIYISGNRLYYANVDTDIPAFRCYFNLLGGVNDDDVLHVQPRLMVAAPDGEIIEQTAEEETVETRKYIENGILVIERNGIKYDAQGHIIK